jgi:hypothetical protein
MEAYTIAPERVATSGGDFILRAREPGVSQERPHQTEAAWRPAPENLDRICCFHYQRAVSNDNVVQWAGRRFQISPHPQRFQFRWCQSSEHASQLRQHQPAGGREPFA